MSVVERLEIWIDAHAQGAINQVRQFEGVAKNAGVQTGRFDDAIKQLGLNGQITAGVLNTGVGTAVAAVGFEMGKYAINSAHAFEQTAETVRDFANATGFSAEQSSRWVEVAGDYQVSADKITLAITRLAKNIQTSGDNLTKYGVQIEYTKDGAVDLEGTLLKVIDAMNATNDETVKAAIGQAAFGRGWQDMATLISRGSDQIRSSLEGVNPGQVFSAEALAQAEQYRLSTDAVSDSLESLRNEVGQATAPTITAFNTVVSTAIDTADSAARAFGFAGLGGAIVDMVSMAVPGIATLRGLGAAMEEAGGVTLLKSQTDEEAARAAYAMAAAMDAEQFSANKAADALRNATSAAQSMAGLTNGLAGDFADIAEIQERLANGGRTLAEIQDAQSESASRGSSTARAVADAQRSVEDAERRVQDQTERLTEVQDKLTEANQNVEDATRKLTKAQEALNDARSYDPTETILPAEANAKAIRDAETARLRVADAQDQVAQSEADYQAVLNDGTSTVAQKNKADRDRRRALLDLEQAQADVIAADREQSKTAGDLTAVDMGLKSSSGDLEQATKDVEEATRNLTQAQDAQKNAARAVTDQQRALDDANRAVEDSQRRLTDAQTAGDSYSKSTHQPTIKTETQLRDDLNQKMEDAVAKAIELALKAGDEQAAQQQLADQMNHTTTPAWLATNLAIETQAQKLRDLAKEFGEGSEGYNRLNALAGLQEKIIQNNNAGTIASYPNALDLLAPEEIAKMYPNSGSQVVNVNVDGQNLIKILLPGIMSAIAAQG